MFSSMVLEALRLHSLVRRFFLGKTVSFLYNIARMANDVEKISSGDPKKIARRAKNKYIGKKLVRKLW